MRTTTYTTLSAALLAASASGLGFLGPSSTADPAAQPTPTAAAPSARSSSPSSSSAAQSAQPSAEANATACAALSKVQPAIDELRDKTNLYLSNQAPPEAAQPSPAQTAPTKQASPSSSTATASPTGSNLQGIADSLRQLSGALKTAEPNITDTTLRNSTSKLATTANDAASDMVAMEASSPNLLKLSSLGFNITSTVVIYQLNHNRVCGQVPIDQQVPVPPASATAAPAASTPAKPATSAPAAPTASQSPQKPN